MVSACYLYTAIMFDHSRQHQRSCSKRDQRLLFLLIREIRAEEEEEEGRKEEERRHVYGTQPPFECETNCFERSFSLAASGLARARARTLTLAAGARLRVVRPFAG